MKCLENSLDLTYRIPLSLLSLYLIVQHRSHCKSGMQNANETIFLFDQLNPRAKSTPATFDYQSLIIEHHDSTGDWKKSKIWHFQLQGPA